MNSKKYKADSLHQSFVNVEIYPRIHPRGGKFHVILSSAGLQPLEKCVATKMSLCAWIRLAKIKL